MNATPRSITALEAQTGDVIQFRQRGQTCKAHVLSCQRDCGSTKIDVELAPFDGAPDFTKQMGASDHLILVSR